MDVKKTMAQVSFAESRRLPRALGWEILWTYPGSVFEVLLFTKTVTAELDLWDVPLGAGISSETFLDMGVPRDMPPPGS